MKSKSKVPATIRRIFRVCHRDLSYFFTGIIIIYAVSGIAMNHKRTFNADYKITQTEVTLPGKYPQTAQASEAQVISFLRQIDEEDSYMKHYYSGDQQLKIFLRGGSSLTVDMNSGRGMYEKLERRPILSWMTRLHYNPDRAWTYLSDIFAICLLLIVLTGLFMNKGRTGLWGRGGIELIIGISLPIIFGII